MLKQLASASMWLGTVLSLVCFAHAFPRTGCLPGRDVFWSSTPVVTFAAWALLALGVAIGAWGVLRHSLPISRSLIVGLVTIAVWIVWMAVLAISGFDVGAPDCAGLRAV